MLAEPFIWILVTILLLVLLLIAYWKLWFLRDPERNIPQGNNIVSPADGKVIEITEAGDKAKIRKGYLGRVDTLCNDISRECYIISIFMSVFDVHINRAPMSGTVSYVRHKKGRFKIVNSLRAAILNEKAEMTMSTDIGNIKVIQAAGFVARRIVNWKKEHLTKGERYGLINLGSQLIVILPKNKVEIRVKKGDKVKAGETIIADY